MASVPGPLAALGFYLLLWAVILVVPFVAAPLKRFIADLQLFVGVASLLQAVLMVLVSLAFLRLKGFAILPTLSFKPTRFRLVLWGAVGVVPVGMISGLVLWPLIEALPWLISKELEFLVRLSRFSDLPDISLLRAGAQRRAGDQRRARVSGRDLTGAAQPAGS
jgi:hypothetical protein